MKAFGVALVLFGFYALIHWGIRGKMPSGGLFGGAGNITSNSADNTNKDGKHNNIQPKNIPHTHVSHQRLAQAISKL